MKSCRASALAFCLTASLCAQSRDVSHRNSPSSGCAFVGSSLEGFNQRSIVGQGYTRVFTGVVQKAEDISDTEERLELLPKEVFVGDKIELTATVKDACLPANEPEPKAGDEWLFFVRPKFYVDEVTHQIVIRGFEVPWFGPSKAASEAEDELATLRRLVELTDKGILSGHVFRVGETSDNLNPKAIPNHNVIAKNLDTGVEYKASTNSRGRFEFELPHGHYEVSASTKQGLRDADPFTENAIALQYGLGGNAVVRKRDWTEIDDFRLVADGKLAGEVTSADGLPASFAKVAIIPISPVRPQFIVDADENGHFEIGGRQPGKYLVGVGLLAPFDSTVWKSRVYYPGVTSKKRAKIIELGDGEWRTGINLKLRRTPYPPR